MSFDSSSNDPIDAIVDFTPPPQQISNKKNYDNDNSSKQALKEEKKRQELEEDDKEEQPVTSQDIQFVFDTIAKQAPYDKTQIKQIFYGICSSQTTTKIHHNINSKKS